MLFRSWDGAVDRSWPPVTMVTDHRGVPHVLVCGHAEVRRVLADQESFRPDNALDAMTPIPVAALRILAGHGFRLPPTLANNGGPSHPEIRRIVAEALHPHRVEERRAWLTGLVRRRVARLATRLRAGEPVDLYADLAADLPLLVLAKLVELPDSDVAVVKEFSRAALELFWAPLDTDRQIVLAEIVGRYHAVLRAYAREAGGMVASCGSTPPGPAYARTSWSAPCSSCWWPGRRPLQFLTLLLHRLTREPEVLAGLGRGEVDVDAVVEEGLRLEPPIVTWRRVAARDTDLGGVPVPAGTSVVLWLARAARDPAVTAAPDEFRPGQPGSRRHLAFGAGAHRCLGAQLSRMEAAVVVAEAAPLLHGGSVVRAPWCPDNLSLPDARRVHHQPISSAHTRQSSNTPYNFGVSQPGAERRNTPGSSAPTPRGTAPARCGSSSDRLVQCTCSGRSGQSPITTQAGIAAALQRLQRERGVVERAQPGAGDHHRRRAQRHRQVGHGPGFTEGRRPSAPAARRPPRPAPGRVLGARPGPRRPRVAARAAAARDPRGGQRRQRVRVLGQGGRPMAGPASRARSPRRAARAEVGAGLRRLDHRDRAAPQRSPPPPSPR